MGNIVGLERLPKLDLVMSNGLTSSFINIFGLSGSALAKREQDKKLVVYVLEKNQSVVGIGTVGFDVGSLPWDINNFEADRTFILSVVNGMRNKLGWEKLQYKPSEEHILRCINEFERLILNINKSDINIDEINEWLTEAEPNDPINNNFPICPVDGVLLTLHGCQVCTD